MKNGEQPIVPATITKNNVLVGSFTGLTKREYFAAMAMQGMLANPEIIKALSILKEKDGTLASQAAIVIADAMLKQLENS